VENAWDPVLRAIQPYHCFTLTSDGGNSFLARLVYMLRWWSSSSSDLGKQELEKHLLFLREIRVSIANELRKAESEGEIKARDDLELLIRKFLTPYCEQYMLVTTNWDTVVESTIERLMRSDFHLQQIPLHIHGSIADPSTMYLPSEMTKEPYRSIEEENSIGAIHEDIWRGLESAHRVIVYGLSIDPLDAELGQTLACGWSNPLLEEILIVNPNHKVVAQRVNLLLDRERNVEVKGINPMFMDVEVDYTIRQHRG